MEIVNILPKESSLFPSHRGLKDLREKHTYFNLYLRFSNRLRPHQSGNGKQHSVETLNMLTSDSILDAMDNGKLSSLILLDLSKAFDSIYHSILPRKLSNIGASHEAMKWFQSYLSGRTQNVRTYAV